MFEICSIFATSKDNNNNYKPSQKLTTMKANENKAQSANVNNNNESNNNVAAQPATTSEPKKAIEQKRSDILKDCFKEISVTEIQKSTIERFSTFGKFTAMYRGCDKQQNGKFGKSGGKTIYNFETPTTIYMGYTSSELAAVFNLPKREYKSDESKSTSPAVCELRKLKNYIDNLTSPLAISLCEGLSDKLSNAIDTIITLEKEYDDFCDKYKTQIEQAQRCTLEVATAFCGSEFIKQFHDFGFKCSDEKQSDTDTESNASNASESK